MQTTTDRPRADRGWRLGRRLVRAPFSISRSHPLRVERMVEFSGLVRTASRYAGLR